ncbi:hypothetical protein [Nocardioides sp. LML1-1-1.1]|uniref:hypothetical protein n=1 Tax=Nocardioides sp. LML1-1-1.1 TaxID=3135248 RepID=UPI0034478B35
MLRGRGAAAAVLVAASWGLTACGHENDGLPLVEAGPDYCAELPWSRNPDYVVTAEVGRTPEAAVLATADAETEITGVLERKPEVTRVAVERDGQKGVYEVVKQRRGWVVMSGDGCATGIVPARWPHMDPEDMDCATAPPDDFGQVFMSCTGIVDDPGPGEEAMMPTDLPPGVE